MIDHFKIILHQANTTVKLWEEIPLKLRGVNWLYNEDTREHQKNGEINGLTIKVNKRQVSIEGNVGKYLYGDNIVNLTREDVKTAFLQIENDLQISLQNAVVVAFEFGAVIPLNFPITLYLSRLGYLARATRNDLGGELVYKCNQFKTLAFYDKSNRKKEQPQNLLRYEIRYKKRVSQQIGKTTVSNLYEKKWFNRMVDLWLSYYCKIDKQQKTMNKGTLTQKPLSYLVNLGLKRFAEEWGEGLSGIEKAVEEFSQAGRFKSKSAKQNFKRGMKKAFEQNTTETAEEYDLINELTEKIKNTAEKMKNDQEHDQERTSLVNDDHSQPGTHLPGQ